MKLNNIDLNKLKVLHAVIKNGSYAAASDKLNITKSAISQSISSLESQLGFQVFIRKGKKLIPTDAAYELYESIDLYQKDIESRLSSINKTKENISGTIRIGSYLEFAKSKLTDPIKSFLEKYPDVQIKFRFDSPTRLQKLLEDDYIDMAFSIYPVNGIKEITSQKVLKEELVLICPKSWSKRLKNLEDILKSPLVDYFEQSQALKKWIFCHYKKKYKKLPVSIYGATAEMVLDLVSKEMGIGVVPNYLVTSDVHVLRPTENQLIDYIWLNRYKEESENFETIKAFSDFVTHML